MVDIGINIHSEWCSAPINFFSCWFNRLRYQLNYLMMGGSQSPIININIPGCWLFLGVGCRASIHAYTFGGGSWAVVQRFNPFLMEYLSRWRGGYKDDNDGRGSSSGAPL